MNRIERTFARLRKDGGKAFIPYIMAGDPSLEKSGETVLLLERCGADIVELGIPFTDPLADGPTIQRASERALKAGVTLRKVVAFVKELRQRSKVPLVIMTYYNPVFKYGESAFIEDAVQAGIDGVIIPDLPPDEAGTFIKQSRKFGLGTIFLLAPTSTGDRIKMVARVSSGFIYYVSMTGITGSQLVLDRSVHDSIGRIRIMTDKPVAVGFGISTPEEAHTLSGFADGIIVGSALVRTLSDAPEQFEGFVRKMRAAIA